MESISDTVGSVLIEVQPDFANFERDLTKGLRKAADNAQKDAAGSFTKNSKFVQESQKSVTQFKGSSDDLSKTLQQLSFNIEKNNRALANLNRNVREGTKTASQGTSAFSRLVEVIANLSIIFNAIQSISAFVNQFKSADLAAQAFGQQLVSIGRFAAESFKQFAKNVTEVTRVKKALLETEKAVTKTGRTITGTAKKTADYGKATKQTIDTVRTAEKVVGSQARTVIKAASAADKAVKSNGLLEKATSGVSRILNKFKGETGAANLELLTGGKIINAVSGAFKGLGKTVTKTATTSARSVRDFAAATVTLSKTSIFRSKNVNDLTASQKIMDSLSKTAKKFGSDVTKAATTGGKAVKGFATSTASLGSTVLFGKKNTDILNKSFRQAVIDGTKAQGVIGGLNAFLIRFSGSVDKGSNSLGRFNILQKVMGETARGAFGKLGKTGVNTMNALGRSINSLGGIVGTAGFASSIGSLATGIGALVGISTVAGGSIVALAQKSSTLAESTNAFSVMLDDAAPKFKELIGNTQELGLSQNKMQQALVPLVPILKGAGLEGDALAEKLNLLVRRGVDLSSVFNEDVGTSLTSITAAIRGEIEPARRLGISFNAAEVEAKALSLGFEKIDGDLSEAAKQFARLELVMEKSADSEGDFANTSTELANSQRILGAIMDDTIAKISAAFLPAAKKIISALTDAAKNGGHFVEFFKTIEPLITNTGTFIAGVISTLVKFGGTISKLILPILKILMPIIDKVTELFGSMVVKLLAIALVTSSLRTLVAVAGMLPAVIGGISIAVASLIPFTANLSKVIFVAAGVAALFGANLDASGGILGTLGKVFGAASEIIKIFVARAVLIKTIGPILKSLDVALKQLSFNKLALGKTRIDSMTKSIGRLASSPMALVAFGAAFIVFNKLNAAAEDTTKVVNTLFDTLNKEGTATAFQDFVTTSSSLLDNVKSIVKEEGWLGAFGSTDEEQELIKYNARLDTVKKRLEEAFNLQPHFAEKLVNEAERTNNEVAPQLRAFFDDLKRRAEALGQAIETPFAKINEVFTKVIDKQKALEQLAQNVETAEKAVADARKTAEDASKRVTEAIKGEEEAARQVTDAINAETDAKERVIEIDNQLQVLAEKRLALLADTIRDVYELADAEDELASIGERIRDIGQERVSVLEELAELSRPATAEELAESDREITKATIALNRAKRDEQKLLEELNKTQQESVDLTGLSLDQLKTSLADIRARTAAQRAKGKEINDEKTLEEIEEEKTLARIGTIEAEESLNDLREDREKLETRAIVNAEEIRELTERLVTIDRDEASLKRDQVESQKALNLLKSGETSRAIELRDLDLEITNLAKEKKTAEEGVAKAAQDRKTAEEGVAKAAQDTRDARAEEKIAVDGIKTAEDAVLQAIKDQKYESDLLLGTEEQINRALVDRIGLNATLGASGALAAAQGIVTLLKDLPAPQDESTSARRDELIGNPQILADIILKNPNKLRDILRNLGVSGFAKGGLIQGVPGAFGKLIRVGEFGRSEAVLPLTRPAQLQDVLAKSQVLHPVLNALGRISLTDAIRPATMGTAFGLAPNLTSPRSGGLSPTESVKPSRVEIKLDRLIQLLEVANDKELRIEAPITVNNPNPDKAARQTARQLERRFNRQSRLRG